MQKSTFLFSICIVLFAFCSETFLAVGKIDNWDNEERNRERRVHAVV